MSRLKLAVIGGGHLGRIHARLAQANAQFEVVAVADPCSKSQARITSELNLPAVSDYRVLLGQIDAAIIATPTVTHYEIGSHLLREGIHCLIEKPLAISSDQAARLVQIAKRHARVLQTGHVERFNPKWTLAIEHLGVPKYMEALRCGVYSGRSVDIGVVMDLMIHDIDLILSLDRSPLESVEASGLAVVGSHEDLAEARLTFASGLVANLKASRLSQAASRRMQIYTTTCYADIDFSADQLKIIRPSPEILLRNVALDDLEPEERMANKDRILAECLQVQMLTADGRNAILDEHNDFAISIQTGSSPAVSGEDGARAVAVADRILEAISRRKWDGKNSRPWRSGARAMPHPRIIPIRPEVQEQPSTERRAG